MSLAKPKRFALHVAALAILVTTAIAITSCDQRLDHSLSKTQSSTSLNGDSEPSPASGSTNESDANTKIGIAEVADDKYLAARHRMVSTQFADRDIVDRRVLEAMKKVPRHEFVPAGMRRRAYDDSPLPIGHGQTISQPYIVALMTQLVQTRPDHKALDIGTGSGYQAAVLAELVKHVYSIEIVEPLATEARERLKRLGYQNITVRHGDGYRGWESEAPFNVIIVAAAPDHVPKPLVDQLAPGGKMVIPVGDRYQKLIVIERSEDGTLTQNEVAPVAFVPMTGEADR